MNGGKFFRLRSTIARPADNTAYAGGDEVSNSATAGSVVRATFNLPGFTKGHIHGAMLDITPASGNLVITAADFELAIFHTADAPAAVGDNVTNPISAETMAKAIGVFRFDDGAWSDPLGALTASTSGWQRVPSHVTMPLATPTLQAQYNIGFPFNFDGKAIGTREFTAVLRTLANWTPTGVINTFGITLDFEAV